MRDAQRATVMVADVSCGFVLFLDFYSWDVGVGCGCQCCCRNWVDRFVPLSLRSFVHLPVGFSAVLCVMLCNTIVVAQCRFPFPIWKSTVREPRRPPMVQKRTAGFVPKLTLLGLAWDRMSIFVL